MSRTEAVAVFVPSVRHFDDGRVPAELIAAADVVTVDDQHTHTRPAEPADSSRDRR
ncbi:hypothetical protein [Nocardia sp. NPDC051981]|uniref:hypothetical protein n=1 Tax=Nocardia sp. NPDC051981 TaxID=3155417 RepID=UPI0034383019